MEAMIDHEHVVNVADRFGETANDLDRLLNRCPFEHRRVFRLHQAAGGIGWIAEQLLDPRRQRPRQSL
jgi:hypothetical protein